MNKYTCTRKIIAIDTLAINFKGLGQTKVKEVYWISVLEETSRSYVIDQVSVTVISGACSHIQAYHFFKKPVKVSKKNTFDSISLQGMKRWNRREGYDVKADLKSEAYKGSSDFAGFTTKLYCHRLEGKTLIGEVIMENNNDNWPGTIKNDLGEFHFFNCNFKGQEPKEGQVVEFILPNDAGTFSHCGVQPANFNQTKGA